jgi:sulfate transport system permease protein
MISATTTTPLARLNPRRHRPGVLPGFGLSMGMTVVYLSLLVLLPLAILPLKSMSLGWEGFWHIVSTPQAVYSYKLTFGSALLAACINAVFGMMVAWVLVRYEFPGKKIIDAMVDLPFALPTAVAGIALTALYAKNGWLGEPLAQWFGVQVAFTPIGIVIAMIFIGLPFVVRTVQPVLEDIEKEIEEAASSLGADRWDTVRRVLFPLIVPALLTGFALSFARAVGEYGSIVFIAGNRPMVTEITPLLIMSKLEQFDYAGAAAIATVMLVISFVLLLLINGLQGWQQRRNRRVL